MSSIILLLGGNKGDVVQALDATCRMISERAGTLIAMSQDYESEPWGYQTEQWFINRAVELETNLNPTDLLNCLQQIEKEMGRTAKTIDGYEDRPIDIDILFYDQQIIEQSRLVVPHPRMAERRFVLLPLSEKWGSLLHPVSGLTINQMLDQCTDDSVVRLLLTH
jgi:2-amino-4-hydroxy-6-hydroxymethyldihydropteridine diphosphokinase